LELGEWRVLGGDDGGDDGPAAVGDKIAPGAFDLGDESVSAEES
jgi:hypothetical protein